MRMRSTGLGRTELIGRLDTLKLQENHLIFSVRTTEPVRWHVRVAVDNQDIRTLFKHLLKFSTLKYLFTNLWKKTPPNAPSNY